MLIAAPQRTSDFYNANFETFQELVRNSTDDDADLRHDLESLTLPDVGYDWLPKIDSKWADYVLYVSMLVTFIRFTCGGRMRATITRRWATCLGMLFALRGISIVVTPLPNPDHTCESNIGTHESIFLGALKANLKYLNHHNHDAYTHVGCIGSMQSSLQS